MARKKIVFRMQAIIMWHLILFLSFIHFGCASIAGYERQYAGTPKPLQEIALLTHINPYSHNVVIRKIDGEKTSLPALIELPGGIHRLDVTDYSSSSHSKGMMGVELDARPGHVYVIYRVIHTHKQTWLPALWDITSELSNAKHKSFVNKVDAILKKNRPNETLPSVATLSTTLSKGPLAGFAKKIHGNLKTWVGKGVTVTYSFDRYRPFITAIGSDGERYHIQLNPVDGSIIKVLGRTVYVNKKEDYRGFQPLNSDLVYVGGGYVGNSRPLRTYQQASDGTFNLISK